MNSERVPGLMYADDLVQLSETAEGLQKCLDILYNYCSKWKLHINTLKIKIMVMTNGNVNIKHSFFFNKEEIP